MPLSVRILPEGMEPDTWPVPWIGNLDFSIKNLGKENGLGLRQDPHRFKIHVVGEDGFERMAIGYRKLDTLLVVGQDNAQDQIKRGVCERTSFFCRAFPYRRSKPNREQQE